MDEQAFDRWFREFNSWGFSIDELLVLAMKRGDLERPGLERARGDPDEPRDVVYISPRGSVMTRFMAGHHWESGRNYKTGWAAAMKHDSAPREQEKT